MIYKCKYFNLKELCCPHAVEKYSEDQLWSFLDERYKITIDFIRELLNKPMVCNSYSQGYTQRGTRCNMCEMVKSKTSPYLSAHVLWKAGDFTVKGMSAEEARNLIVLNQDKLPYPIRLEDKVTWLHIDTYEVTNYKVYLFRV